MEEEENYLDKPVTEIGSDILGSKVTPYVLGGGLTTALGSVRGGSVNFDPRILGNMQTQVMKNAPGNKLGLLLNPKRAIPYAKYAKNTVPQAVSKNPMSVVKAGGIPLTAALIAGDIVSSEADRTQESMQRMSDIEGSQISDAGADLAERLRRLNLIEEQRSFDAGVAPFGGEEGITMGNLDEYFAANPNFSGIGDVEVPDSGYDQGGKFLRERKYDFEDSIGAPALDVYQGGVDYSSAFQGNQAGAEQSNRIANSPLGMMTNILENLPSSVTDDQRAEIASGMLKPYLTTSQEDFNARNKEVFDKAAAEYKEQYGERPDFMKATPDTPAGEMSMADYRTLARQKGFTGSGVNAAAKQLQIGAKAEASLADLNRQKTEAAIAESQRPERERAPTASEFDLGIAKEMSNLQGLINSGQELNPQQQATFDAGNAYIKMKSEYGESPFEQVDQTNVTPIYSDAEQKMIDKMKAKYPDRPEIEIIEALRADKRIA